MIPYWLVTATFKLIEDWRPHVACVLSHSEALSTKRHMDNRTHFHGATISGPFYVKAPE